MQNEPGTQEAFGMLAMIMFYNTAPRRPSSNQKGSCQVLLSKHSQKPWEGLADTPAFGRRATTLCPEPQTLTLRSSSRNSPVTSGRLEKVYWTLPNIPRGIRAAGKGEGHGEVPSPSRCLPSLYTGAGGGQVRPRLQLQTP